MTSGALHTWRQLPPVFPGWCSWLPRLSPALGPQVLTSPLSTAASWLRSEVGCTMGRAVGFIAISCTDPEDVSKGSAATLPELSKRTAPSSSSLAGAEAQINTSVLWLQGSCMVVGEFMCNAQSLGTLLKMTSETTASGLVPRAHCCSRISFKFKIYTIQFFTVPSIGRKEF